MFGLGWISKQFEKLSAVMRASISSTSGVSWLMWPGTASGEVVSPQTALLLTAVFRAVRIYAEAHLSLPIGVYSKVNGKRILQDSDPVNRLLTLQPNPQMTASTFWTLMEHYRLLWGNFYAEIEWNGRVEPRALWPIEPWRVTVQLNPETKKKEYIVDGKKTIADDSMIHIPDFTLDGLTGVSRITWGRESLGRSLGAQRYGSSFFKNDATPRGLVKHPGKMERAARDNFRKEWRENNGGDKAGSVGVLFEGMDFLPINMPYEDSQFLSTSKAGVDDISMLFGVPPHRLAQMDRATYANGEQGDIEFVKYSLVPMCITTEQELNTKLINWPQKYIKHTLEGFLRGDTAARSAWYKAMKELGVYNANRICELEDIDGVGPDGDVYYVNAAYIPTNMVEEYWSTKSGPPDPSTTPGNEPTQPGQPGQSGANGPNPGPPVKAKPVPPAAIPQRKKLAKDPYFIAELGRMQRRENKAIEKAAKQPTKFPDWLTDFIPKHRELLGEVLEGPRCAVDACPAELALLIQQHCENLETELNRLTELPLSEFPAEIGRYLSSRDAATKAPEFIEA